MIKIALIGAPTSRKTELAQQLKSALKERDVVVIDDYIKDIERRSNVVLGHYASYLGNLQSAIGRFEAERLATQPGPDLAITCGTLVENAVYVATLAYITNHSSEGDTGYQVVNDMRASLSMTWIGVLKNDLWDYDLVYYLPLKDKSDRWNEVVDDHIPEAASTLDIDYTVLDKTLEENLATVLQEILALETTPLDESTSGNSAKESEVSGVGPGPVSDVSE